MAAAAAYRPHDAEQGSDALPLADCVLGGLFHTAFSEWVNTVALQSWKYSEAMPMVMFAGTNLGMSPLVQWLLLPPLALWLARKQPGKLMRASQHPHR